MVKKPYTSPYAGKRRYWRKKKGKAMALRKKGYAPLVYGIPTFQTVKMKYACQIRIDPYGPGLPSFHVFRANSVHDPDYTGISGTPNHQPMFHDQYAQIYANYKVIGSKITILGTNDYSDNANTMGNLITCTLANVPSTTLSKYSEVIESKGTRYAVCQERTGPAKLVCKYSAKKFHAIKDVKDAIELQGIMGDSGIGQNPAQEAYFVLAAYPLFAGQDSYPACLNIQIDYICLVYNHKRVEES